MIVTILIVKVLQTVSGVVTFAGATLVAFGEWSLFLTSVPLIIACLGTTGYYVRLHRSRAHQGRNERGAKGRLGV